MIPNLLFVSIIVTGEIEQIHFWISVINVSDIDQLRQLFSYCLQDCYSFV